MLIREKILICLCLVASATSVNTATVRLTNGHNSWSGYLEVYHNGRWGTVCDDGFSNTNGGVVCRQLGHPGLERWSGSHNSYGLTIWLDNVSCSGHESRIEDCSHNAWGHNDCNNENVQITCKPNYCTQHNSVCQNGGHCVSTTESFYRCDCPSGTAGIHCENDIDECNDGNNGGCSHQCNNLNYTGNNCSCPDAELELGPDQHTCYSPHAGITCTSEGMTVSLVKAGLPGLRAEYLKMDDTSGRCLAVDTPTHIVFNLPLHGCGTTKRADGDEWLYENHITSRHSTVTGTVSTVRKLNITVRCRYPQHEHVHDAYHVIAEQLSFQQDASGQFPIKLVLEHEGHVYQPDGAALVTDPGAPLTVHFSLENSTSDLDLFVRNCAATPTSDTSTNATVYQILRDGCPLDSTLQSHRNGSDESLTLQAFKFVGNSNTVFLHCDVVVCDASNSTSRCQQGCLQPAGNTSSSSSASPASSRSFDEGAASSYPFLEERQVFVGALHITRQQQEVAEETENEEDNK